MKSNPLILAVWFLLSTLLPAVAALVTCPDCASQVSDRAEKCPKCGCPAEHFNTQDEPEDVVGSSVLIVTTSRNGETTGAGTASVMRIGGDTFIVTNQHVVYGSEDLSFNTVSGHSVKYGALELLKDGDLARFAIAEPVLRGLEMEPLEVADSTPAIGTDVTVFGNSEGASVLTRLDGKVLGVSASLLEVDAEFVEGNSGSPLVGKDSKVLGVATYVAWERPGWVEKDTRFAEVRRFCTRVPRSPESWRPVKMATFQSQARLLQDIESFAILSAVIFQEGAKFARTRSPDEVTAMFSNTKYRDRIFQYVRRISALERKQGQASLLTALRKECERIEDDLLHCNKLLEGKDEAWVSGFLGQESDRVQHILKQCMTAARGRNSIVGQVSDEYGRAVQGNWQEIRDGLWQLHQDLYSIRLGLKGSRSRQEKAVGKLQEMLLKGGVQPALFVHYLGYTPQQVPSERELRRVEDRARNDYYDFKQARTPAEKEDCLRKFEP